MNNFLKYSKEKSLLDIGKETIDRSNKHINSINTPNTNNVSTELPNIQPPKRETADDVYMTWKKDPSKANMDKLVKKLEPTIDSGMMTYTGTSNPLTRSQAKRMTIGAIKSYSPEKESSLPSWVILNLQGLKRSTTKASPINVPERVRLDLNYINSHTEEFIDENGREPSDEELADLTGLSIKRINYVRRINRSTITEGQVSEATSYDSGSEDSNFDLSATFTDVDKIWLDYVYTDLDPINKQIFDMRLGRGKYQNKPMSVGEIAKTLKISPSAVSQRTNKIADEIAKGFEMGDRV